MNDLQSQIDQQRQACRNADIEVMRCEQALENAEKLCQIKHDALGELLNLQDLAKSQENAIAVGPQIARWL